MFISVISHTLLGHRESCNEDSELLKQTEYNHFSSKVLACVFSSSEYVNKTSMPCEGIRTHAAHYQTVVCTAASAL